MIGRAYDLAFAPLRWALGRAFDPGMEAATRRYEEMEEAVETEVLRTARVLVRGRWYVKEWRDDGRIYFRREEIEETEEAKTA